jgi:hypothetical protein
VTHTRSDHRPHSERAFARAGFTTIRWAHARLAAQFQPNGQPRCLAITMPQTIQGARRRTGAPAVAEGSHQRRVAADQPARRQDLGLGGLLERVQLGVRRGRADAQLRRDVLLAACVPRARSRVRGAAGAACCNRASGMRPQPPASTRRKPPMSARWPNRISDRSAQHTRETNNLPTTAHASMGVSHGRSRAAQVIRQLPAGLTRSVGWTAGPGAPCAAAPPSAPPSAAPSERAAAAALSAAARWARTARATRSPCTSCCIATCDATRVGRTAGMVSWHCERLVRIPTACNRGTVKQLSTACLKIMQNARAHARTSCGLAAVTHRVPLAPL